MVPKKVKIFLLVDLIIILAILFFFLVYPKIKNRLEIEEIKEQNQETISEINKYLEEPKNSNQNQENSEKQLPSETKLNREPKTNKILSETEIPAVAYLEVPFYCQAPLETEANWVYHEESCEEAALLQAYLYEMGNQISKEEANTVLLDMIEWQNQNMGGHHDLYSEAMQEFIVGYYDLDPEEVLIIEDASIEDIKREIANDNPVIAPITGEILQNPYYPYPGYHMLTVIGYTEDKIVTNDNGTRHGADFSYNTEIFEAAFKDSGGDILVLELKQ